MLQLLEQRLERGELNGEQGFILDGFPRTAGQADKLLSLYPNIQLALNMGLREEVLVEKCLGEWLRGSDGGKHDLLVDNCAGVVGVGMSCWRKSARVAGTL